MPGDGIIETIGAGGLAGLILTIFVVWGIRDRVSKIERTQAKMGGQVMYRDTCAAIQSRTAAELAGIKEVQKSTAEHLDRRLDEQHRLLEWLVRKENGGVRPPGLGG